MENTPGVKGTGIWHRGETSSYLLLHPGLVREPWCLGGSLILQGLLLCWLLLPRCALLLQSSPCTGKDSPGTGEITHGV